MKEKILNLIVDVENGIISRLKCAIIIDSLINQEVEKRIAERMPSDVVSSNAALDYCAYPDIDGEPQFNEAEGRGFQAGIEWLLSRLSQKTDNLKENNNDGSTN